MSQPTLESLRRWDPERIGPYTLLGRLGAGAMGQVYLGRSTAGRLVAVKTIKIDLAEEPGFRDRFAREVAAARRVSGVFTAAVVAADADADLPWLATAYVPAPSLTKLVRAEILGVAQARPAQSGIGQIGAGEIRVIQESTAQIGAPAAFNMRKSHRWAVGNESV